jgi:hypothetical protein
LNYEPKAHNETRTTKLHREILKQGSPSSICLRKRFRGFLRRGAIPLPSQLHRLISHLAIHDLNPTSTT